MSTPSDWPLVKLSDLGEVNRGRSRHRPRYAEHLYGGPYPFIQTGDIRLSGGRITSHQQTYSDAGLAQSRLWPAGTMCITIAANIAETGILTYPACFPDSVVGFIGDPTKCSIRFIEFTFRHLRRQIQHEATGSVTKIANARTLQTMRELNQSRNGFSHSAAQSESQARAWISEIHEDVLDILDDIKALSEVNVLRYVGQTDAQTLRCEVFRGHGFTRTIRTIPVTADQLRDSIAYFRQGEILLSIDDFILDLCPLLYHREDAAGQATRLCMFRKTRGEAPNRRLEYEVVGDAVRHEIDRGIFRTNMNHLRALFGMVPE